MTTAGASLVTYVTDADEKNGTPTTNERLIIYAYDQLSTIGNDN